MSDAIKSIKVETRSVKWLVDEMRKEQLFIDDSFQRKFVWLEKHQVSLIETILKGMPIPEIYLWEQETNPDTGETKHSIIDGQQRIRSVYRFINNEYLLKESFLDDKEADYIDKYFKDLTGDERSKIWNYPFSIRFVGEEVSKDQIRAMFLRLNNTSLSLNPQELRNAEFQGKFIETAVELSNLTFWEDNKIFNVNDLRRMLDIQFVSSILIFLRKGIEEETTQKNINLIYDTYNEDYPQSDEDKQLIKRMLEEAQRFIDFDEVIAQFLRKKTHLYILLVTIYYILSTERVLTNDHISKYKEFVAAYEDETNDKVIEYFGEDFVPKIQSYRKLSLTGTQAKANRLERFKILKEVMDMV